MSNIENHIAVELTRLHQEIERLRALNAELSEKVKNLTKLLDDQLGTPCEQIRHAEEKADLLEALQDLLQYVERNRPAQTSRAITRARAALAKHAPAKAGGKR